MGMVAEPLEKLVNQTMKWPFHSFRSLLGRLDRFLDGFEGIIHGGRRPSYTTKNGRICTQKNPSTYSHWLLVVDRVITPDFVGNTHFVETVVLRLIFSQSALSNWLVQACLCTGKSLLRKNPT